VSFEDVSILFEGFSYTEVNISTGFNVDNLSDIMYEKLHNDAKLRLQQLTEPEKK
jgi:hypothetical protein